MVKGTGGLGNKRLSGDHPNYNINRIGQNTEKSPGDLRRLAITQTPVKGHQLTLMRKTLMEYNCRIIVSEFVLQSLYYVHFREIPLGKA